MEINLKNKVIIITGAGKGFGFEISKLLYSAGASIAVISRNRDDLIKLKNSIDASNDRFFFMEGDVSIEKVVVQFVEEAHKKFNRLDCLINNAGIRFRKNFLEITNDEWKNVMNVNLGSTFLFSKAVLPIMKKQNNGKIINIASIVGSLGFSELSAYASSKGAIISLTKSLAIEFSQYNINVNAIAPGFCKTSYEKDFKKNVELYESTIQRTPLNRWGESKDIANACIYLASELSDYVTGEIINIDGGWSAC